MGTTKEDLTKGPNVERITKEMEEVDQLRLQNILYKIQLEQERVKVAKLHVANSELREQMATQELKMWEETYKMKLSENKYDIQSMNVDADSGQVVLDVLPKRNIDGSRPVSKSNGKDTSAEHHAGV